VLGHSMGGKAAMALALSHPDQVGRMIVADIAPVTYTHSHRPSLETMQHVDLTQVRSRADADRQMVAPMPDAVQRAFLLQNLVIAEDGSRWKANLASLSHNHDAILSFPDIDGQFEVPALFLSGELSDYVAERHAETIRAKFPDARFQTIAGAGHWLHADKPEAFIAAVSTFLQG
jgi:esterase